MERPHRLAAYGEWSNFTFRPTVTHLTNHEEFSGILVDLSRRFIKRNDDNGYAAFDAGLQRQVQGRAARDAG